MGRLLLALVCFGALGCTPTQTYEGRDRSGGSVAVLFAASDGASRMESTPGLIRSEARFTAVDGRALRPDQGWIEVLPGTRRIQVRWARRHVPPFYDHRYGVGTEGQWIEIASGVETYVLEADAGASYELQWEGPRVDRRPAGFRRRRGGR